jgi:transcriptional regulator with XRE-family HTH domain
MEYSRNRYYNNLRRHRKLMGYSLKDIGFLLNLKCTGRLSRWEQGVSFPNLKNVIKLGIIYRSLTDQFYFDLKEQFRKDISKREKILVEQKRSKTTIL